MIQYFPTVTGSLTVNGDLIVTGTGSMSASLALNSNLLQGTGSTGFATTASLLAVSSSQQQISSSLLALTASYTALSSSYTALSGSYNTFSGSASTRVSQIESVYATTGSNSFRANQSITGSLVVSSTITAQTLVVQTVTSSIVYSSGSNLFGSALGDRQTFTGSVNITGSQHSIFGNVGIGIINPTYSLDIQVPNNDVFLRLKAPTAGVGTGNIILESSIQSNSTSRISTLNSYNNGISIAQISSYLDNHSGSAFLSFQTATSGSISEKLRITNSGNVVIGTTSSLDPDGYGANRTFLTIQAKTGSADRGAFLELVGTAGGNPNYWLGRIGFFSTTAVWPHADIHSFTDTAGNYSGILSFGTTINATTTSPTERMRISSNGHVGIVSASGDISPAGVGPRSMFDLRFNSDRGMRFAGTVSGEAQMYAYQGTASNNLRAMGLYGSTIGLYTNDASSPTGTQSVSVSPGDFIVNNKRVASTATATTHVSTTFAQEKIYDLYQTSGVSAFDICTITSGYVYGAIMVECVYMGQFANSDQNAGGYKKSMIKFANGSISVVDIVTRVDGANIGVINYTYVSNGVMKVNITSMNTGTSYLNGIAYVRVVGGNNSNSANVDPLGFTMS